MAEKYEGSEKIPQKSGDLKGAEEMKDKVKDSGKNKSSGEGLTAEDSTTINPKAERPIDKDMPNMPPA